MCGLFQLISGPVGAKSQEQSFSQEWSKERKWEESAKQWVGRRAGVKAHSREREHRLAAASQC